MSFITLDEKGRLAQGTILDSYRDRYMEQQIAGYKAPPAPRTVAVVSADLERAIRLANDGAAATLAIPGLRKELAAIVDALDRSAMAHDPHEPKPAA